MSLLKPWTVRRLVTDKYEIAFIFIFCFSIKMKALELFEKL
jgi:hypothetical protein